jgi:hypothetical protein
VGRRHYLVVVRDVPSRVRVASRIRSASGVVLMQLPAAALIAEMSDVTKAAIAALPEVHHCGGVEIAPPPIRRIRVGPDRTPLNA